MKDFFIAYSASSAAVGGIIFAFLISKALGFESSQSKILDNVERKILDIKKINSKILTIAISKVTYEETEADLLNKYSKELERNYFKWQDKEINFLIEYVKKENAYYLRKEEAEEKLKKKSFEFLEYKYNFLKKIIKSSKYEEIEDINGLKKYDEFEYLKNNVEYNNKLKKYIKENLKIQLDIESGEYERVGDAVPINVQSQRIRESKNSMLDKLQIRETQKKTQKEIGQLLVEYAYEKEKMEHLLKKITNLRKERNRIFVFLGTAYFMMNFGVIYPLSYTKYSNGVKLDYTIYNNFFYELFSFSGFMLFVLFVIFTIFTGMIYYIVSFNNELTTAFNKLRNNKLFENKSYIIENFEYYQNN